MKACMKAQMATRKGKYTCNDSREEMILLGLQKRLNQESLSDAEKKEILKEIETIEKQMGM